MVKKFTEVSPYTGRDIDEGPTNTTGPSVAGTGDDSSTVVVRKKKKETLYDGRTKHAKRFVERILKMREKRKVSESKMSDLHAMIADGSSAQEISKELKIPLKTVKELMKGFKEEVELDEKVKQLRQLINPSKEAMVVKNNKVIVVDKKDLKQYTSKGWSLAEEVELEEMKKVEIKLNRGNVDRDIQKIVNHINLINKKSRPNQRIKITQNMSDDSVTLDGGKNVDIGREVADIKNFIGFKSAKVVESVNEANEDEIKKLEKMLKDLEKGKKTPGKGFAKIKIKQLIADLKSGKIKTTKKEELDEQPEHEITVGDYTTSHFYMCGSAQKLMKANKDKVGAIELTRLQDEFYKLEKDVMDAGEASELQKQQARKKYNQIMNQAAEIGLADDMSGYMKQHLDSVLKGDPKPGFGRTDESFEIDEGLMAIGLFSSNPREINKAGFDLTKFMKKRPPANINGMKKFSDFVQKYISEDRMGDRLDMMAGRFDDSYDFDHKMFLKLDPRGVVLDTLLQYDRNLGALLMARTLIDYGVQVVQINMDKAKQGMYSVQTGRASRKSIQSVIDGIYGTMAYKGINYAPKTEVKEMNFTKSILKQSNEFAREYELVENNLKVLQNIVKNKQNMKMKFKDKQAKVDLFTASAIMNVYNAVRPDNKKKLEKLMNGKIADFLKLQAFAMKQIK